MVQHSKCCVVMSNPGFESLALRHPLGFDWFQIPTKQGAANFDVGSFWFSTWSEIPVTVKIILPTFLSVALAKPVRKPSRLRVQTSGYSVAFARLLCWHQIFHCSIFPQTGALTHPYPNVRTNWLLCRNRYDRAKLVFASSKHRSSAIDLHSYVLCHGTEYAVDYSFVKTSETLLKYSPV